MVHLMKTFALTLGFAIAACSVTPANYKLPDPDGKPAEGCTSASCDDPSCAGSPACPAVCGNGKTEGSEECDDGNQRDGDSCEADCTMPHCGNHIIDPGEGCDDGPSNGSVTSSCTAACRPVTCNNGVMEGTEQCDDGNNSNTDACLTTCATAMCGDGFVHEDVEQCDDGISNSDTSACLSSCKTARCGDSFIHAGVEQCDDGDASNGNTKACLASCQIARCGDGFIRAGVEQCDDGSNNGNSNACLSSCVAATCGDGFIRAGVEQCDDGTNNGNTRACTASCKIARCGDGLVEAAVEDCDEGDGNNGTPGGTCDATCHRVCTNNLVPAMTSPSTPSGTVTQSGAFNASFPGWQAFDATTSLWLSAQDQAPAWVAYEWGDGPRTVTSYAITFANGSSLESRGPRDFTLQGWNGATWIVIDTRTGETNWSTPPRRVYTVAAPGSYFAYKLNVTDDNDPSPGIVVISIGKLEFIGCPVAEP
jgi:cysteine-rich repeat protein